jgi:O-antigen ligase
MTAPALVARPALVETSRRRAGLPGWPFALPFVGYPAAWLLGLGDAVFVVAALIMVVLLARYRSRITLPPFFLAWLGFIALMLCSVAAIDSGGRLVGFIYRAVLYASLTVMAVYVYSARERLTTRNVLGVLTVFWLVVVAGGFLGVALPLLEITTPLAVVLPHGLTQNELVHEMVYRRTTQFNPDAWTAVSPRPSAPFLYTNGWGMAYSLLVPVVIAYLLHVRGQRRFLPLLVMLPISLIPALATLNRGMLVGLALAAAYAVVRLAAARRARVVAVAVGVALAVLAAFPALPTTQLLSERLEVGNSTEVRSDLYTETWERTLASPVLGYGAPRPSETAGAPSAGTQGQLWMVLFSHGIPAAILFVGWFAAAFASSLRSRGPAALALNTVLLVFLVEIVFYGALATGLAIALAAGATVLRSPAHATPAPSTRIPRLGGHP